MEKKWKRIIMAFTGVFMNGICIALFKTANLGNDPFNSLSLGIWNVSGIPYSIVLTTMTGLLLVGVFVIKKHFIGAATLFNLFFLGAIAERFMSIFGAILPELGFPARLCLMLIALVMLCFASSLYFTADLGVSAYDAWALILAERKVASFRICRIGTDVICVTAGALMGIYPGIGTLITAFGMGPLIDFFNRKFSRPFLEGELFGRQKSH